MSHKGIVKFSVTIVRIASWLMLVIFGVAGIANALTVFRGGMETPDGPMPKWAALPLLLVLWAVGLFVFALYYLIATAIELLGDIRDNTTRA